MLTQIIRACPLAFALFAFGCSGFTEVGQGSGGDAGAPAGSGGDTGGSAGAGRGGSPGAGSPGKGGSAGSAGNATGASGGAGGSGGSGGSAGSGMGAQAGSGGGTYDPCAGKACGASCTQCDPNDTGCGETADVKVCDAEGLCQHGASSCGGAACQSVNDCVQPGTCMQCSDGSSACASADCVNGSCVSSFPSCPAECEVDDDCPQILAPCTLCPDGSSACPWSRCENGTCQAGIDSCTSADPCDGKSCGDTCSPCTGADCPLAPAVIMYCDSSLACQLNQPVCDGGCQAPADCAVSDTCVMCADGTCAQTSCVNGACVYQCPSPPSDPCGGCKLDEVCIEQAGGPGPAHLMCVARAACGANGICACIYNQGPCQYREASGDQPGICVCDNGLD